MTGRLLLNVAYRHLRDRLHHVQGCARQCAKGCPVYDFHASLNEPVLPRERAAVRAEEDRMQALARGDFTHLEGAGDEAGPRT